MNLPHYTEFEAVITYDTSQVVTMVIRDRAFKKIPSLFNETNKYRKTKVHDSTLHS